MDEPQAQSNTGPAARATRSTVGDLAVLGVMLLVLLAGLVWLVGLQGVSDTPESVGSTLSAGERGTEVLYKWLDKAGWQVDRVSTGQTFPPAAGTLVMINPNPDFPEGQSGSVRRWIEGGHTLILAMGARDTDLSSGLGGTHPMLSALGIDLDFHSNLSDTIPLAQPLLDDPPVTDVKIPGVWSLAMPITGTTVLLSSPDQDGNRRPLAAILKVGEGRVFVVSSDYPFSNLGIRDESNGAFVYNLVRLSGDRRVVFDEAHHGATEGGNILVLLTSNPWGWAIIYGLLLLGIYVFWSGRRLGPALPVWSPDRRRPTADYVRSVGALFRRARKPGWAAEHYLQYFKRTLSRHAELDPYLTDARFVQSLAERGRFAFDQAAMARAIERLRKLEGGGSTSESVEAETLSAIRDAEEVRRQALGMSQADRKPEAQQE
jgi:hypothetical protein